jgi:hypothetical protein
LTATFCVAEQPTSNTAASPNKGKENQAGKRGGVFNVFSFISVSLRIVGSYIMIEKKPACWIFSGYLRSLWKYCCASFGIDLVWVV